jgi:hypothetical protein
VLTAGIDLAAQPANTGICVIDWEARRVVRAVANDPGLGDDELVAVITDPAVERTGVDAPFGWPDEFVAAVRAHHDGAGWPEPEAGTSADPRQRMRLRRTDLVVAAETGRWPMSVSADRIAVAAMRCARLQWLVAGVAGASAVDRSGVSGRMAETYPAASLAAWALPATGYKGAGAEAVSRRATSLTGVLERTGLTADDEVVVRLAASDHIFDALVCAVVARAILDGATAGPPPDERDVARREGWIHWLPADWSP